MSRALLAPHSADLQRGGGARVVPCRVFQHAEALDEVICDGHPLAHRAGAHACLCAPRASLRCQEGIGDLLCKQKHQERCLSSTAGNSNS
jgi:hypothetical protein